MSRVSYFQRFSQRENHATNNTLLLMHYFYEESPRKLYEIMSGWFDVDASEFGMSFQQQIRHAGSVPDGKISQRSFEIYFETKHGGTLWEDQLRRHIDGIPQADRHDKRLMLIGLTTEPQPGNFEQAISSYATGKGVSYKGLTFSEL